VAEKIRWDLLVNDRQFKRGMRGAEKSMGGVQQATRRMAGALAAAFGAREIVRFGADAIDAASDYTESMNAVEVATGDAANEIFELGKTAATELGLSKTAVNEAAVAFAAFGEKINAGDVGGVFEEFIGRATDFASVMNLDVDQALTKFQSGLAGETEPLRKFGIDISAAAVSAFALANGIGETGEKLTETEKVQARYGLLLRQTDKFAGDFANTSGELANQMRIQTAEMENASIELGKELLPLQLEWVKFQRTALIPTLKAVALTTRGVGVTFDEVTGEGQGFSEMLANNGSTLEQLTEFLQFFNNSLSSVAGGGYALFKKGAEDADLAQSDLNRTFISGRPIVDQYGSGMAAAVAQSRLLAQSSGELEGEIETLEDALKRVTTATDKMRRAFSGNLFGDAFSKRQFEQDLLVAGGVGSGQTRSHRGGVVPGRPGENVPMVLQAGERVSSAASVRRENRGGGTVVNVTMGVVGDPVEAAQLIIDLIETHGRTNAV